MKHQWSVLLLLSIILLLLATAIYAQDSRTYLPLVQGGESGQPIQTPTRTPTPTMTMTPTMTSTPTPTITSTATATNVEIPTSTATNTPTATATDTAQVVLIGDPFSYTIGSGHLYIVGQFENIGSSNVRNIFVTADFYDSSGHLVGVREGISSLHVVLPGQRVCFRILDTPPTSWAYYLLSWRWDYGVVTAPGLQILNESTGSDQYGNPSIIGLVKNNGTATAFDVRVAGTLYDASSRVIGCSWDYVSTVDLNAGDSSSFDILFLIGSPFPVISTYNTQVQGEVVPIIGAGVGQQGEARSEATLRLSDSGVVRP